ncbi:MAG: hypothetical protein HW384_1586 [Dehalococcoidia bacterium]|nr:hypothetical protein [Dehalococcoidia bacterium]
MERIASIRTQLLEAFYPVYAHIQAKYAPAIPIHRVGKQFKFGVATLEMDAGELYLPHILSSHLSL